MELIVLRGYPGSGKTTLGQSLEHSGAGHFVDHNQILDSVADIAGDDDGLYSAIHSLEQAITKKLLQDGKSAIVARGFGSADSIQPYIAIAKDLRIPYRVFRIDAPIEILKERVQSSSRKKGWNPTTTPEALEAWVNGHPMEPIDGERILDGTKPVEELARQVIGME